METKGIQRNEELGLDYYSSYGDLYDWELYFDAILLAYYGGEDYAIQGLRIFLAKQQASGFIPRRIPKHRTPEDIAPQANPLYAEEKKEHCKPFLFQIALIISRTRNSTQWITPEDYDALYAYLTHWFEEWDQDQNDLCEWSSAPHSGSDTQLERIGPWGSRFCEGTDLNCFIYRDCQAASYLARALGHDEDAQMFENRAQRTAHAIRSTLWNDEEGMFYDRDARDGKTIKVKSASTFLAHGRRHRDTASKPRFSSTDTLTIQKSSPHRSPCQVTHAVRPPTPNDSSQLPALMPVLGLQAGHANWCGGMWPHWNIQISHGLQDYGFDEEANLLADKLLEALSVEEGFYEWYDAETGAGCGVNPFWAGATVLGATLPVELKIRFNPMEPKPVDQTLDFQSIREIIGATADFKPLEGQ